MEEKVTPTHTKNAKGVDRENIDKIHANLVI